MNYCVYLAYIYLSYLVLFLYFFSIEQVNVFAQFCSESGDVAGPPIELPLTLAKDKLQLILNTLLKKVRIFL